MLTEDFGTPRTGITVVSHCVVSTGDWTMASGRADSAEPSPQLHLPSIPLSKYEYKEMVNWTVDNRVLSTCQTKQCLTYIGSSGGRL